MWRALVWTLGVVLSGVVGAVATYFIGVWVGLFGLPDSANPASLGCFLQERWPFSQARALPTGSVRVLVARLQFDDNGIQTHQLRESLRAAAPGIETQELCESLAPPHPGMDDSPARQAAEQQGRQLLQDRAASVLVWGEVRSDGGFKPRFLTPGGSSDPKPVEYEPGLELSQNAKAEVLGPILAAHVLAAASDLPDSEKHFVVDRLKHLLSTLRDVATNTANLPADQAVGVRRAYTSALRALADQTGDTKYASEALAYANRQLDQQNLNGKARAEMLIARGMALQFLGEQGRDDLLQQAASALQEAAAEYSKDHDARAWAAAENDLGRALFRLGEGAGGTAAFQAAARAYEAALTVRTRSRMPVEWAATTSNLADDELRLSTNEAQQEEAIQLYMAALTVRTQTAMPLAWAKTQTDLCAAREAIGEALGTKWLIEAEKTCSSALTERTRDRVPMDWAATTNDRANVLVRLGEREKGTKALEAAAADYRDILSVWTRERAPKDWAMTQSNLGAVYSTLGERTNKPIWFWRSIAAHGESLKERSPARSPSDWSASQNNLGSALVELGELKHSNKLLQQGLAALQEAEKWREPDGVDWGATRYNMGLGLRSLGKLRNDPAVLQQALAAFADAQAAFQSKGYPAQASVAQHDMELTKALLPKRRSLHAVRWH
jgi:tetratricopeptide (TPR) repeat protein